MGKRILGNNFLRLLILATLSLTLLTITSCATSVPQELTNNEKLWKDQDLENYDFTLERQCFCPEDWRGPVNIEVRGGTAVSVTYQSDGSTVTEEKFENVDTIDKLFTLLNNAFAGKGNFDQKADSVDVTYDEQMGYPVTLYIDVSQQMADEEQGYTITNLVAR